MNKQLQDLLFATGMLQAAIDIITVTYPNIMDFNKLMFEHLGDYDSLGNELLTATINKQK